MISLVRFCNWAVLLCLVRLNKLLFRMENNRQPQWKTAGNGLGSAALIIHLALFLFRFFNILVPILEYGLTIGSWKTILICAW